MELSEVIIERIERLVKIKGITVNTLLKDCGINKSLISDLKSKGSIPSADKINKIADYFDVPVDFILGRIDYIAHQQEPTSIGESAAASSPASYDDLPPEALKELENYREFLKQKYGKK